MNKKTKYILYEILAILIAAVIIIVIVICTDSLKKRGDDSNSPESTASQSTELGGSDITTANPGTDTTASVDISTAETTASEPVTQEITTNEITTSELTTSVGTASEITSDQTPSTSTPEISTGKPAETTSPEVTTCKPAETTSPEVTTGKPAETTSPEVTTGKPEETTSPEVTTGKPEETTSPEVTTGKPVETTSPETTTETNPPETTGPGSTDTDPTGNEGFSIVMSFAGDTQLADNKGDTNGRFQKAWNAKTPSYFLDKVRYIFEEDDFSLLNLECVLSDRDLEASYKSGTAYWYKGKTEYLEAILSSSIEAVSLTNNHVYDYGEEGYADTLQCVLSAGLIAKPYGETIYYTKNGFTVAIICEGLWSAGQNGTIINKIKAAEKNSDFQIVYWHGGYEYEYKPRDWQIQCCHAMVDAGADLVIGNHAHVLQPIETYKDVRIVYSLGNFCYGGMARYEKTTIIYQLKLTFNQDGVLFDIGEEIIPCYYWANACQPVVIKDAAARQQVFDFLNGLIDLPMYT